MDFDEVIGIHSKWKRKLRQTLAKHDHSLRPSDISLDHKCVLGTWIYAEGTRHCALPEYTKLKFVHAHFHTVAAELVKRANSGEAIDAELEPCSSSGFSAASAAIVMALMALKKRLSEENGQG
jgi:methyl-accepting chemotaxis protein